MNEAPLIVKVGGSLLDLPELGERLANWLKQFGVRPIVLLVGGGDLADRVRQLHSNRCLDDVQAHWLAVAAMSYQTRLLEQLLLRRDASWPATEFDVHQARRRLQLGEMFLMDAEAALRQDGGRSLPIGWQITSDSIAAWLAHVLGVRELVLLKSIASSELSIAVTDAQGRGWLDKHFAISARGLTSSLCCFREPFPRIVPLTMDDAARTIAE